MAGKHTKKKKIIFRRLIMIILIITFVLSSIYIIKYFYDKNKDKQYDNVLENTTIDEEQITEYKTERMLQLEELQKENSDIIGWIEIEDTNINYPVLQGKDNEYYMTRTYKKEYSKDGSLFLDKDYNWDIPSTNLLIYGHNNSNGNMFEDLEKYQKEDFYKTHPTIRFTTKEEDVEYEIIAVFLSRVYYKSEKNVFRYYYFINAETEAEFNEYVENAKKASLYDTAKTAEYGDGLMTLSTCSYHTEDGRLAVVARKVK